ncbi:MAG: cytochrome c3 family protein [Dehalococcoidales bacterium]|nr:cytochrome c3 family protein [Dehalococcoidales bacterium]
MLSKKLRTKLFLLIFGGAISLVLLTIGVYQMLNFMDSNAFCGKLCHTVMNPEYTTYQSSPHSRVSCVTCHVGKGVDFLVKSKIRGIPQIYYTLTGTYPRPITTPVSNLRPARDTCEECHRPEKFVGDAIKFYTAYATDENNTKTVSAQALRIGGGTSVPQDIHWHIGSQVWYVATDDQLQNIAWVGVTNADGATTEWVDSTAAVNLTPDAIQKEKRLMDCIDCHNRATHVFYSPEELIDNALSEGTIDATLPYIKAQGMSALDPVNSSLQAADQKIDAIRTYYQTNYPAVSAQKSGSISAAITELKRIAELTTFPEMNVSWKTHIDNSGHQQYPGCFRCHGKLVQKGATGATSVVDARCNLCHYPVSLNAEQLPIVTIPHKITGFTDCLSCHGKTAAWPVSSTHDGRPNDGCTGCHQVSGSTAPEIPHSLQIAECSSCHGLTGIKPYPANHAAYNDTICALCHSVGATHVPLTTISIPHNTQGFADCLSCHNGATGKWPVSATHVGRTNATCTVCHEVKVNVGLAMHRTDVGSCATCHNPAASWPYPSSHATYTEDICSLCHNANTINARTIPHSLSGRSNCLFCHGAGSREDDAARVPSSHSSYTNVVCTVCHR